MDEYEGTADVRAVEQLIHRQNTAEMALKLLPPRIYQLGGQLIWRLKTSYADNAVLPTLNWGRL